MNFTRLLQAPPNSFFLFGPRGVGKSTWVKEELRPDFKINLFKKRVSVCDSDASVVVYIL